MLAGAEDSVRGKGRRADRSGTSAPGRGGERLTGLHPIREALAARRRELRELCVRASARHPGVAELAARARAIGVAVRELEGSEGERLDPPGLALEVGALPEPGLEELLAGLAADRRPHTLVALDGVEDPQNLGAIVRVAEAAGAAGLILTRRHAPPLSAAVSRASAGAVEWLPVARVPNLARALRALQSEGFWTLGADPAATDSLYDPADRLAGTDRVLVLGAEGRGLRPGLAGGIDRMLRIPLGGKVASLNVATAAAVLLFELRRRSAGSALT